MIKLVNAGFERLRKNKIFWLLTLFSIGIALFIIGVQYKDVVVYDEVKEVEQLMLNYATIVGIVMAIFISLFLGVEYSDGGIRNKISIGHKRGNIYLANLLIVTLTCLFSYVLFMLVMTLIGIPLFGVFTMEITTFLKLLGCIFVTIMAYASIFTFFAMIISNKTITAIVCIMLSFLMMMSALVCFNILEAPPTVQQAKIVDGKTEMEEVVNPKYPSEEKKKFCRFMLNINPAGQMFQIAGRVVPNLKVLPLYSIVVFIIFTGVGMLLFKKKEIK